MTDEDWVEPHGADDDTWYSAWSVISVWPSVPRTEVETYANALQLALSYPAVQKTE